MLHSTHSENLTYWTERADLADRHLAELKTILDHENDDYAS